MHSTMTTATPTVAERWETLAEKQDHETYNFRHFGAKHLAEDGVATFRKQGIQPGELAPDFVLPNVNGGTTRLSDLRGKPLLLHFGSYT